MHKENFSDLVERAIHTGGRGHMRPVIEKELLHYDILFALDKESLLDNLTFQGGTALRLCYGSHRYSEDLDFVGGRDFATADLTAIKHCVEHYVGERYDLNVEVKNPKEMSSEPQYEHLNIDKWRVSVTTSPERKDIPKQKIKLEIANIPAYTRIPKALQTNYDFLPDGYRDMLVLTESLDEIMADKLISLVDCQKYIRHRDIWDLRWLMQQKAKVNIELIKSKIQDYKVTEYENKVLYTISHVQNITASKAFLDEMMRFLPNDILENTLRKPKFQIYLSNEIENILSSVLSGIESEA